MTRQLLGCRFSSLCQMREYVPLLPGPVRPFIQEDYLFSCRNPLLLCVVVAAYYVGRALWVQLDASAEFENGLVSVEGNVYFAFTLVGPLKA